MSKLFAGVTSLTAGTINLAVMWPEPYSALLSGWCYGMGTILMIAWIAEIFSDEESL